MRRPVVSHSRVQGGKMASETKPTTDDELIERYIEFVPGRPGHDRASLRDAGIEVWALIASYQGGAAGDIDEVAKSYDVPVDAVRAALAYYAREKRAIDARLRRIHDR
jgi:uncharacterized protein (DUF433 family)